MTSGAVAQSHSWQREIQSILDIHTIIIADYISGRGKSKENKSKESLYQASIKNVSHMTSHDLVT